MQILEGVLEDKSKSNKKSGFMYETEFMMADDEKNLSKDVSLSSPIYLELRDNGGFVKFRTFQDALNWANEELDAWRYISVCEVSAEDTDFVEDIINQQTAAAENIAEASKDAIGGQIGVDDATSAIRRYLDVYAVFNCIHSRSVLGKMAITMERHYPMVLGMLAGATASANPEAGRNFINPSDAEAFTFGYALALPFRNTNRPETMSDKVSDAERRVDNLVKRLEPTEATLSRLNEEQTSFRLVLTEAKEQVEQSKRRLEDAVSQMSDETRSMIEKSVDGMWAQIDELQIEHESQIASLKKNISSHLKVRASVEYWVDVANAHATRASQAIGWFIITGLFSIMAVVATAYGLNRSGLIPKTGVDFISLCAIGLPVFVSVLLLIMIAKSKSRHEKMASMAEERVAMVETFTSLESEGKAKDSERHLMLKALFNSSYAGKIASNNEEK
jgi:Mg2+ and Co2+ transporter CorA